MEHPCPVLPDDIIEDIFTRLPARTALGCRGLSHAWAAALSSDAFVDRNRRAANRHGGPRFFIVRLSSTFPAAITTYAWSPACCDDGVVPLPSPVFSIQDGITLQCRGLVIVDVHGNTYCAYNPSTGRITALPPCRLRAYLRLPSQRRYESLGIGYDARCGQHKVVCIYYRGDKLPVICEVYVVDNDSGEGFWRAPAASGRQPDARKPAGWVSSYESSVFAQGHVHWMAQKQKPKQNCEWRVTRRGIIVSVSLADEAFGVVQLPPGVDYLGYYHLTDLEGRLCLFTPTVESITRGRRPYDVWLLRDHEAGTWDLRCRIDLDAASPEVVRFIGCRVSPVAAMDHGRRLLFMPSNESSSFPCAYTPATGDLERLPCRERMIASHTYGTYAQLATLYEESVVSTGRPHEDILFSPVATKAVCGYSHVWHDAIPLM